MKQSPAHVKQFLALARVSSREQAREGFSLDVQEDALRRYAGNAGGKIVKFWSIAETASRSHERKVFKEMVAYAKQHANALDGLLFYKIDRAVRNLYDLVELERLESEYDVPFISISQPTENNPAGRMMRRTLANMATFFTEQLSVDVRDAMARRVQDGWFPCKAWYGWRNVREDGRSIVVVDERAAANVRRMFELVLGGSATLDEITDRLHAEGRTFLPKQPRFTRSHIYNILTNPAYYGHIRFKGHVYEGRHQSLVSKADFDRVQAILRRKGKPHAKDLKPYLYRGIFRCGGCGCVITTETQKSHHYLRCTRKVDRNCRNPFVREEVVTNRIKHILRSVALPAADADWMLENLEAKQQQDATGAAAAQARLQDNLEDAKRRLGRLAMLYVKEGIKDDEYASMRTEMLNEKHRLAEEITRLKQNPANRLEPVIRFVKASKQAGFLAEHGSAEEQRDLFTKTGSNPNLLNRQLVWEPRGAWQLVAEILTDQGFLAHHDEAAYVSQAASSGGESRHHLSCPPKWAVLDSNQ